MPLLCVGNLVTSDLVPPWIEQHTQNLRLLHIYDPCRIVGYCSPVIVMPAKTIF